MDGFKFTSWNIQHSDKLLDDAKSGAADKKRKAKARLDAIGAEISALAADILLITEGPNGEDRARALFDQAAPDYELVVRGEKDRAAYGMRGTDQTTGRQWIWFLIRKAAPIEGELLHLDRWSQLVEDNSDGEHRNGRWDVSFPKVKGDLTLFDIERNHRHWRHPQTLLANIDGELIEFIGAHLKSKFTRVGRDGDPSDDEFFANNPKLVAEMIKARVKITTECADIRHYLDQRFDADPSAPIVVAGDLNDGPGKERIERRFLYHDLVSTLQGEIFFARRFLNHALFDVEEDERWSVFFKDKLDPGRDPRILLDHILFSQSLTGNPRVASAAFRAKRMGGRVEHEVHHAVTGVRPKFAMTSDHKPISMEFVRTSCNSG